MQQEKSKEYIDQLSRVLAGSAHYNFREAWHPKDIVFSHGNGCRITDIDGNEYLDFYSNFGSNILGHSHRKYIGDLTQAMLKVSSSSLSNLSMQVSEQICAAVPSADLVRFSVTGTEAVQTAIRLARAYTGREKLLRFTGNYHGHADNTLGGKPSDDPCPHPVDFPEDVRGSKGLAKDIRKSQSILTTWNNPKRLTEIVTAFGPDIACVLTEPLAINGGGIEPAPGYLDAMRELCNKHKIVLIFDEIITGFRVGMGGAQQLYNITPDITTLGKAMGGGALPVSAIAGRKDIMSQIATREVVHAGTFNGYHAGLAAVGSTLGILSENRGGIAEVARNGRTLQHILVDAAAKYDIPLTIQGHAASFYLHVTPEKLQSSEDWTTRIKANDSILQKAFLDNSIILAPISRCYPSVTLSEHDVAFFTERANKSFKVLREQKLLHM